MLQPTLRNLHESFEGWAYRNGLLLQIQRFEYRRGDSRKGAKIAKMDENSMGKETVDAADCGPS